MPALCAMEQRARDRRVGHRLDVRPRRQQVTLAVERIQGLGAQRGTVRVAWDRKPRGGMDADQRDPGAGGSGQRRAERDRVAALGAPVDSDGDALEPVMFESRHHNSP